MKALMILNEAPYGSERTYNALRLAGSLSRQPGVELRVFLMGDAAACAKKGQKVPTGYYNAETMLGIPLKRGASVAVCGTCMDARGIAEGDLTEGARRSTLDELTAWTVDAEKVIVF